jgi:ribokinase
MNTLITTIGGATEDFTFHTHEGRLITENKDVLHERMLAFEYGAKIGVDQVFSTFGGGASNAAVNLSGLGFKVQIVGSLGSDERGRSVLQNLRSKRVNVKMMQINRGADTGFSFIVINQRSERLIFSHRGANVALDLGKKELKTMEKSDWLYIASLSGARAETNLKKIFSIKYSKKIWNPGREQLVLRKKVLANFLKRTDIFCVNIDEAKELVMSFGKYKRDNFVFLNKLDNLLKEIYSYGPKMVVITSGDKGAGVFDGKVIYHQAIVKTKKKMETTGVGDRKSTRLNSSHVRTSRMPSSA